MQNERCIYNHTIITDINKLDQRLQREINVKAPLVSFCHIILSFFLHRVDLEGGYVDHPSYFSKVPTSPPEEIPLQCKDNHNMAVEGYLSSLQVRQTSVRSSGKWKVSRISSGVLPSITRASARLVRSTTGLS